MSNIFGRPIYARPSGFTRVKKYGFVDKMPKGFRHSPETKAKMSARRKGVKFTPEHRANLSKNHADFRGEKGPMFGRTGEKNPMFGKHLMPERIAKLVAVNTGNTYRLGKKHSPETRAKMAAARKWRTGEKSPCWKGGVTPIQLQIRNSDKYKQWRSEIFLRDNFTCRDCGNTTGGNLRAHHLKSFKTLLIEAREYLPLFTLFDAAMVYAPMWDISNGITLCGECHRKNHRKARR